jgi:hypothetical protein
LANRSRDLAAAVMPAPVVIEREALAEYPPPRIVAALIVLVREMLIMLKLVGMVMVVLIVIVLVREMLVMESLVWPVLVAVVMAAA